MLVQKPQEQPTTGPNTTIPSFNSKPSGSNASVAINLVDSIITENNALKQQINRIESGLEKAGSISKGLLKENEALRSLYKERTNDIGKLIKTMSIQCDEEKVDYQHQCHLLQELNFAILKEIKAIDHQTKETNARIYARQFNVDEIGRIKYDLEHDNLNKIRVRLNNSISHENIAKAKRKLEQQLDQAHNIENQINDLVVISTRIGGQIERLKKEEGPQRYTIANEKMEYQQKLDIIIEENKRYIEQLTNDKAQLQQAEMKFRQKSEYYRQIQDNLNAEMRKYENLNKSNNELNIMKQAVSAKIGQSRRYQEEKAIQLSDHREWKKDLQAKIQAQKKKLALISDESRKREEAANERMKEQIRRLNRQMAKNEANANQQINNIATEVGKVNEYIKDKDSQVSLLEEEIGEYMKLIQDHPKSICEIERIELTMKLKKRR